MTKRTQRTHKAAFKAKVAMAAVKGAQTLAVGAAVPYLDKIVEQDHRAIKRPSRIVLKL